MRVLLSCLLCSGVLGCASQTPNIQQLIQQTAGQSPAQSISVTELLAQARSAAAQQAEQRRPMQLHFSNEQAPLPPSVIQQLQQQFSATQPLRIEFGRATHPSPMQGLLIAHRQLDKLRQQLDWVQQVELVYNPALQQNALQFTQP